ncbi:MAG: cache domain-containing protein [Alphaproteobacteria bacterium]|nr:cache domain-containing protein [Alphaproteobacteria bacterium]
MSIRSYLLLLLAATLVPMLALSGVLAWYYGDAARRTIEAQRLDVANNVTNLIDREVLSIAGFLGGLSISPGFQAGDANLVRVVTDNAMARGVQALGLYDRTGRLAVAAPADRQASFAPGDRVGVPEVLGGRKLFVSGYHAGPTPRSGLFYVSVPVMVDGKIVMVLSAALSPQRLQGLFAEAGMREGWRGGVVDRNGIIIARSLEPDSYVGTTAQQPMVDAARGEQTSGLFDVITREGFEVKNSFLRSQVTGWTAAVAVPATVVNEPLVSTAIILVLSGICFVLLSLLLGTLIAGRIALAVYQLGHAVVAFANGDSVPLPGNTITELRDVLRVIESTSAMGRNRSSIPRR